ncbi:hypothetical protein RhiirA4_471931 [Rhizophagus irregularis]|uniref:Actin-like ATPase domain-containing protein n=1 Tax=Rhizophagus irregularis TaxID=588596 RepID=A0A2I1H434_9GLOM|nr:hypothetical protein RhiirA4_471931 [Rhizophagus irregularis]
MGNPALTQKQSKHARKNKDLSSSKTHDKTYYVGKETISTRWHGISFFKHVLLVISIPTEFKDRARNTMRKCLYNAGLTDSEAAAIYSSFMIVDCGGGTVDLTTRRLLRDNKLSEITERMEIFVVFLKFLSRKLGNQNEFDPFEFDIEEIYPLLKHYCNDNIKEEMKENELLT